MVVETPRKGDTSKAVGKRSDESAAIRNKSEKIRKLMGGTSEMRKAGSKYLPQYPMEVDGDFKIRLSTSWLFNGLKKSVKDARDRIFEKPMELSPDGNPADLVKWCENVDLQGNDLSNFWRAVAYDAFQIGVTWVMATAPAKESDVSKAEAAEKGIRPYLNHITIEELIGWEFETIGNTPTLTQVRIVETVRKRTEADRFDFVKIPQIRVLDLVDGAVEVSLWQEDEKEKGKWILQDDPFRTEMKKIYIRAVYSEQVGLWDGESPFDDLADVNIAHWVSQSDQTNALRFARIPMLYMHGYSKEDIEGMAKGAGYVIHNSKDAREVDVGTVETTGEALRAGRTDLKDLEFQMQAMGLILLMERGNTTATGDNIEDKKSTSKLSQIADGLKDSAEECNQWLVEIGGSTEAVGEVVINKEFTQLAVSEGYVRNLISAVTSGQISHDKFIEECVKIGFLSAGTDAQKERDKILEESVDDMSEDDEGVDNP